uniref:Uncharacterized protein n=1 Tax=Mantoniella antarctica TaxID=81844 RepID=A0A7S0SMP9_9CHLO|mmetsp:Transcript_31276/g.78343  ORF Transcript_31276/g.78343 Transcript_31276/m.78343 type:complete len:291 (+) Transcript_31276:481-1353(+)
MLENVHRSVEEIRFEAYKRVVGGHYMLEASFEVAFGQQAGDIATDVRAFAFGQQAGATDVRASTSAIIFGASPGGGLFGASTSPLDFGGSLSNFTAARAARAEGSAAFRSVRRDVIGRALALSRDTTEGAAFASTLRYEAGGEPFGVEDAPAVNALGTPIGTSEVGGSDALTELERRYQPLVEVTPMPAGSASSLPSSLKRGRPPHKSRNGNMTLPQGRASAASGSGELSRQVIQALTQVNQALPESARMLTNPTAPMHELERALVRAESQASTVEVGLGFGVLALWFRV